jgi:pSer/pThr/pTyr-binding forkhead associated (FHA) protein
VLAAVRGALQRDPQQRFRSAAALAEVLSGRATLASDPRAGVPVVAEWEDEQTFPDPGHAVVDAAAALLELASGEGGTMRFSLAEVSTVGAADGATVRLAMPGVEPDHCEIRHDHGRWLLVDRSIAGSRVNGARVPRIQLADGDLVRLGTAVLRFRLGPGAPEPHAPPSPTVPPDAHSGPWLEVPDPGGVRRFPLGLAAVVLGRSPGADIVLDDPTVSMRHARITVQGRDVLIEDLHSHNGVTVNGQRARFRRLNPGDDVRLGQVPIRLVDGYGA